MQAMLDELVARGLLPIDSEVLSTHNNLVVASRSEQVVVRVARLSFINKRVDPGDLKTHSKSPSTINK
jgi:hypothetical protein